MGFFSFMFADMENRMALKIGGSAYIPQPEGFGETIYESRYDGFGHFRHIDIFELVADWNRPYLAQHPEYVIPSYAGDEDGIKRISDFSWYPFYSDLSLSKEEVEVEWSKCHEKEFGCIEYRSIGIILSCLDEDNEALPFPLKVCRNECQYEDIPCASRRDPMQGC